MSSAVSPGLLPTLPRIQGHVVAIALAGLAVLAVLAFIAGGARQSLLGLIGFGAGIALYHASFGFTAAWRRMFREQRSVGLRAQIVMLAATMLVFFPLLANGSAFGQTLSGFVNPVGLALCVGAFIFGIGMQLGGGCGSGTLFTVGGGSSRMLVTLMAFIAGSLFATSDPLGWSQWPSLGAYSLVEQLGGWAALVLALAALALVYLGAQRLEARRYGAAESLRPARVTHLLRGPWALLAGAGALALVNIATLLVAGRPWGITTAFALWGAKIAALAGFDVSAWPYWQGDASLHESLFADVTSVMNFGIMLGALTASGLASKFAPQRRLPLASLLAALVGGFMMGIGARLATGCNIGAFFSGLASGSAHGLVWLLMAIPGNAIGVRLRPLFGMKD